MDIQVLASGIYTAMITTVLGLIVGILAYLAYNYLSAKVQRVVHLMETDIISFLDLLHDKEKNNSSDLIDRKTQSNQISDQIKSNDSSDDNSNNMYNQDIFN